MKVLIISTKYPVNSIGESDWLTSELGSELLSRGFAVDVLDLEWCGIKDGFFECNSHRIYRFRPFVIGRGIISLGFKWFFSSLRTMPVLLKMLFGRQKYDLVISFSPCLPLWLPIIFSVFLSRRRHLIYWDFFPIHNYQIDKQFPRAVLPLLKFLERRLLLTFTRVSCMSPANLKFMNDYFGPSPQFRDVLPIWTSRTDACQNFIFNNNGDNAKTVFFFGGQLVRGRGVETVLSAIRIAAEYDNNIQLIVCGSGELSYVVEKFVIDNPGLCQYMGQLTRDDYLACLNYADVGIVATVSGVSVPTYPSKCLDYMAVGIPIAISIESCSDFGKIAVENGFGFYCDAGEAESLSKIILAYSCNKKLRKEMGQAGLRYLNENHKVSLIVDKILELYVRSRMIDNVLVK